MNRLELLEYFTNPGSGSWDEVGYRPFPLGRPTDLPAPVRPRSVTVQEAKSEYNVVIVGSGPAAALLPTCCRRPVRRSSWSSGAGGSTGMPRGWTTSTTIGCPFMATVRAPMATPAGCRAGRKRGGRGAPRHAGAEHCHHRRRRHSLLRCAGVALPPDDFQMASIYGVPEGSAFADWPIAYEDLEPYYDMVEWEVGVAGEASGVHPRQRRLPMAPWPLSVEGKRLAAAAEQLGWSTTRVPLLINTEARNGRAGCVRCGFCVGFPCPVDAKNGTETTVLPRATAAGAHLLTESQVVRVTDDGEVHLVSAGITKTIHAGRIALAGGAVETARLLRLSRLGNDWVGDCLQGHTYAGALGRFDDIVIDGLGPGPSIASLEFLHGNDGILGGGMLATEFVKLPALHFAWALPPDAPREGDEARRLVAEGYRRTGHVWGPAQEIPTREARVRLATSVTDALGVPVARPEGLQHPDDLRTERVPRRPRRDLAAGRRRHGDLARSFSRPTAHRGSAPGRHRTHVRHARSRRNGHQRTGLGNRPHLRRRRQRPRHQRRSEPRPHDHGDGLAHRRSDDQGLSTRKRSTSRSACGSLPPKWLFTVALPRLRRSTPTERRSPGRVRSRPSGTSVSTSGHRLRMRR